MQPSSYRCTPTRYKVSGDIIVSAKKFSLKFK